jgi:uncharacterized membrane protein (DUF106 family)
MANTTGRAQGQSSQSQTPQQQQQQAGQQPAPELCGGTTGFIMMMVMMIGIFIMFNPGLREAIATGLDVVFNPIFGFGGKYPALTLLFTSIFMVFCSTLIRHIMTDWIAIARAQKIMTAIQKEKSDAMLKGDTLRLKKIEELNPEMSRHQMVLMSSNFKPLVFTMIFFIIVFPWLWAVYIGRLDYPFLSLPGIDKWNLLEGLCGGFQSWILVYMVISFPIGFLIQNGLKFVSFSYKIKQTEVKQHSRLDDRITDIHSEIKKAKAKGITVDRPRELLTQAEQSLLEKRFTAASGLIDDATSYLQRKHQSYERTVSLISEAETMVKNAKRKNIGVTEANNSLNFARKALDRNDDTSAIYYAKQSQRQVKEARSAHKDAEDTLSSVKAMMYDLREIHTEEADRIFDKAQSAMEKKDYSSVLKLSKSTKKKADEIKTLAIDANTAVNSAKQALAAIQHLGLQIANVDEQLNKATNALAEHKYLEAIDLANKLVDMVTTEKDKFQNAQESVSFAKLVVSNAQSFGADVIEAEQLVANAEVALSGKNYDKAIELSVKAKDIAENAKRQRQRDSKRK